VAGERKSVIDGYLRLEGGVQVLLFCRFGVETGLCGIGGVEAEVGSAVPLCAVGLVVP
jgi:hypothetical protein